MIYKTIYQAFPTTMFTIFLIFFNIFQPAYSTTVGENLPFSTDLVTLGNKSDNTTAEKTDNNSNKTRNKARNKAIVLLGSTISTGNTAPDFKVVNQRFKPVQLSQYSGKTILLNIVPSIDTGVGSLQTKRIDSEVTNLPNNVVILTISTDTPFAQQRFAHDENVTQHPLLSDAVWQNFGANYGLLIKDMGTLTRALFVINPQGIVTYKEVVPTLSQAPDYEGVLAAVRALATTL